MNLNEKDFSLFGSFPSAVKPTTKFIINERPFLLRYFILLTSWD